MPAKILIIDDDPAILEGVRQMLNQSGFETSVASTGQAALGLLDPPPDLVVLDLMLPDYDGLNLCREIRQIPDTYLPILMLTARDDLTDKVLGLELGADDYVTKPFEPRELLSRIRAMLRFAQQQRVLLKAVQAEQPLIIGPLKFWRNHHAIEISGQPIELTPTEWELLDLLVTHPGQVFGRETLLHRIWGDDFNGDSRTVDTHVQRLRAKFEFDPAGQRLIQTVRGFGYRLQTPSGVDVAGN